MSTQPVLSCSRCGQPVVLRQLSTATPDPEGKLLHQLMQFMAKSILCNSCRGGLRYYASQGRGDAWQKGDA